MNDAKQPQKCPPCVNHGACQAADRCVVNEPEAAPAPPRETQHTCGGWDAAHVCEACHATRSLAGEAAQPLNKLLQMLQATSIEAAIEQLQAHFDKDRKLVDKVLTHINCTKHCGCSPPVASAPIKLNSSTEDLIKSYGHDLRLWANDDTTEFNLRVFARAVLAANWCAALCPAQAVPKQPIDVARANKIYQDIVLAVTSCGNYDSAGNHWTDVQKAIAKVKNILNQKPELAAQAVAGQPTAQKLASKYCAEMIDNLRHNVGEEKKQAAAPEPVAEPSANKVWVVEFLEDEDWTPNTAHIYQFSAQERLVRNQEQDSETKFRLTEYFSSTKSERTAKGEGL